LAQAAKTQQAQELRSALDNIMNLHRQVFTATERPIAVDPPPVNEASVRRTHRKRALAGVGLFQRTARQAAKRQADAAAAAEIQQLERQRQEAKGLHQAELDRWWTALLANDEEVVLAAVAAAFEDNEAPSAPIGVSGSELSTVVLVPNVDIVPERKPTTTAAGNLSLKKMTKTERCGLHTILVASHVLLTVREALAVAPGISTVRVIALRQARVDAFGAPHIDVLMAASFERSRLAAVRWSEADANIILQDAAAELVLNIKRATHELQPVNLDKEPALQELMQRVEIDELLERGNHGS
jgi:hypothetical protein